MSSDPKITSDETRIANIAWRWNPHLQTAWCMLECLCLYVSVHCVQLLAADNCTASPWPCVCSVWCMALALSTCNAQSIGFSWLSCYSHVKESKEPLQVTCPSSEPETRSSHRPPYGPVRETMRLPHVPGKKSNHNDIAVPALSCFHYACSELWGF